MEHYLDLLDAREIADGWTTSADVEATKPEPDLVMAAREKARRRRGRDGGRHALGRARPPPRAEVETIAVVTGGFAEAELTEAGAVRGVRIGRGAAQRLDETPLGG